MTICDEPSEPPPYRSNPSHVKARRHDEYYFDDGNLVIQVSSLNLADRLIDCSPV
jgi:hypothetical protein